MSAVRHGHKVMVAAVRGTCRPMVSSCRATARLFRLALAGALLALAGCSTTGTSFDASRLDLLVPGSTTLNQASALLGADPVDVYRRGDGSALARWAHRASFVPDAVYFNRELWLQFDHYGQFERVVKSVNVPQSGQVKSHPQAAPVAPQTNPRHPPIPAHEHDAPVASPVQL